MLRLVIADDHPIFRAGIYALLNAESDLQIIAEVKDGVSAVAAARTQQPDLVILDVAMPGMNGVEAARRIMIEAPEAKVLCISMHSDARFVEAAFRSGARGYLRKDCALEELVPAIRAVLAGQLYVSPGLAEAALGSYRSEGDDNSALDGLTPREREVLQLLAEGHSAAEIAARLHVSTKTVGTHREHLMQKLGTRSLVGLTKFAIRMGLTSAEE